MSRHLVNNFCTYSSNSAPNTKHVSDLIDVIFFNAENNTDSLEGFKTKTGIFRVDLNIVPNKQ